MILIESETDAPTGAESTTPVTRARHEGWARRLRRSRKGGGRMSERAAVLRTQALACQMRARGAGAAWRLRQGSRGRGEQDTRLQVQGTLR